MDFFRLYMRLFHWRDEGLLELGTCSDRFKLEDLFGVFFRMLSLGVSSFLARGRGGCGVVRTLIYADSHVLGLIFRLDKSFGELGR